MSHVAVTLDVPCPACGNNADVIYSQSYSYERLRYSQSFGCQSCGARSEAHGGDVEPAVREAFLAAHGTWRTELREVGPNRWKVFERLISDLGFSRVKALHVLKSAPVDVFVGTLPESDHWRDVLVVAGATAGIREVDRG